MSGPTVIAACLTIAVLLVAAWLIGDAELDEILARRRAEREDRAALEEWEQVKRDLGPRSLP